MGMKNHYQYQNYLALSYSQNSTGLRLQIFFFSIQGNHCWIENSQLIIFSLGFDMLICDMRVEFQYTMKSHKCLVISSTCCSIVRNMGVSLSTSSRRCLSASRLIGGKKTIQGSRCHVAYWKCHTCFRSDVVFVLIHQRQFAATAENYVCRENKTNSIVCIPLLNLYWYSAT